MPSLALTFYAFFQYHNSSISAISNYLIVNLDKFGYIYTIPP